MGSVLHSGNAATKRRARLRKQAKGKQLADAVVLVVRMADAIFDSGTAFGDYARDVNLGVMKIRGGLQGNLLPLPRARLDHVAWNLDCPTDLRPSFVTLVNLSMAGINFLNSDCKPTPCAHAASGAQQSALTRLADKWWNVMRNINSNVDYKSVEGSFRRLATKDHQPGATSSLLAHKVDMLETCGKLNVDEFVPSFFAATINDPGLLFTDEVNELSSSPPFRGSRAEYVLLICRQLCANKVVLGTKLVHASSVFTVGKKGSDKLREICNGSNLSKTAARPPVTPWLATPSSLSSLEATGDRKTWMSCSDGRVFFDQMGLPLPLRKYFGKPCVYNYHPTRH